ncbi:quinon protein alcohol dehydrogenase-like superfamily [Syncephalis plumigaleata]|nr:quinon protein alcohol dehydrogenase-like superfamily [Syncephalis plumigaleata]
MSEQTAFTYATDFPVYCLSFTQQGRLLAGGGGGGGKNGVKNKLTLYDIDLDGQTLEEVTALELNSDEDAPMCLSLNDKAHLFACGINSADEDKHNNNNCRIFELNEDIDSSACSINLLKSQSTVASEKALDDDYLKAIRFSSDASKVICGSSSGGLSVLAYPSLEPIYPHRHGEQDILDLDLDKDDDKAKLSFWSLASGKLLETLESPKLNGKIDCLFRACRFGRGETIGAIFVIINSADRKHSTVCKLHAISYRKMAQESINRCPTTAFTISDNGRWLAFAAADLSIGIIDAHNLHVVRRVAQVHSFAITSLSFSPDARLLASGSAASSCHIMPLPEQMKKSANLDPLWVILIVVAMLGYFIMRYPELLTELTGYRASPLADDTNWYKSEEDL